jgi:hypothetical protein
MFRTLRKICHLYIHFNGKESRVQAKKRHINSSFIFKTYSVLGYGKQVTLYNFLFILF